MSKQFSNQSSQVPSSGSAPSGATLPNQGGSMGNAFAAQQLRAVQ